MANFNSICLAVCLLIGAAVSIPVSDTMDNSTLHVGNDTMDNGTHSEERVQLSYGVLLDAGSSSTKLKVYSWEHPDNHKGVPKIIPVDIDAARFKPGLATFEGDIASMRAYLAPILQKARDVVPAAYYNSTPIYCLATAGFRLLGNDAAGTAMQEVEEILMDRSAHPFLFKPGGASVLSGEEEGVYSWLAANYLLDFFDKDLPDSNSVGVLEMGGGSTQIAFIPKDGVILAEEFQVTIAGRSYSVYAQSYLKFGASEVKEKVVERLLAEGGGMNGTLQNPCMLSGDSLNVTLDSGLVVATEGSGKPAECRAVYMKLLAPASECNLEPCAIGSVFQPSVDGIDFYATSAYTFSLKANGAIDDKKPNGTVLDLQTLWSKVETYCHKNITDFPAGARKWASANCQGGVYVDTILTEPYGFSRDTKHIQVTGKIGGESIDWALGAMLHFLSMSFTNNPQHCSVMRR